jgi:hypothetical protein
VYAEERKNKTGRTSNCIVSAVFIYKYKYIMMVKDNKNTVMGCSHCVLLARMHGERMICLHLCKLMIYYSQE